MRGAIYDQPAFGDLPDDFKYGTTVSESAPEIRRAFVRKVFTILRASPLELFSAMYLYVS